MLLANMFHVHDLKLLIFQICGFSNRYENDIQIKVSDILFVVMWIFYLGFTELCLLEFFKKPKVIRGEGYYYLQ